MLIRSLLVLFLFVLLFARCNVDSSTFITSDLLNESVERGHENILDQIRDAKRKTSSLCYGKGNIDYLDLTLIEFLVQQNRFYVDSIYGAQMIHLLTITDAYDKILEYSKSTNNLILEKYIAILDSLNTEGELTDQEYRNLNDLILEKYKNFYIPNDWKTIVKTNDFDYGVSCIMLMVLNQRETIIDAILSFMRGSMTGYDSFIYPQLLQHSPISTNVVSELEFVLVDRDFSVDRDYIRFLIGSDTLSMDENYKVRYRYQPKGRREDSLSIELIFENPITGYKIRRKFDYHFNTE